MNWQPIDRFSMRLAGAILFVVGILKLSQASTTAASLAYPDPVLPFISVRLLLLVVGQVELFFAILIALRPQSWHARYGLLALCGTFVAYRLGLYSLGIEAPCPCLGRAPDWLHLSSYQADRLAHSLIVILGAVSIGSIITHRQLARHSHGRGLEETS